MELQYLEVVFSDSQTAEEVSIVGDTLRKSQVAGVGQVGRYLAALFLERLKFYLAAVVQMAIPSFLGQQFVYSIVCLS